MKYSSPGHIDLLGIGKVMELLSSFINKILHWKQFNEVERIKLAKEQIEHLKLLTDDINKLQLDEKTQQEIDKKIEIAALSAISWIRE